MSREVNIDLSEFGGPKFQIKGLQWIVAGIFGILFLFTLFSSVATEEVGVIQCFGAYNRTVPQGLHIRMPFGIETFTKVSVERQFKEEFGFRTKETGIRTVYESKSFSEEKLMLTGVLNASDVEWIVQYRIADPYTFLFKVRNVTKTFREINEALMREVVGERSVNEVLTIGRVEVAHEVARRLHDIKKEPGFRKRQIMLEKIVKSLSTGIAGGLISPIRAILLAPLKGDCNLPAYRHSGSQNHLAGCRKQRIGASLVSTALHQPI